MNERQVTFYTDRVRAFLSFLAGRFLTDSITMEAEFSLSQQPIGFGQRLNGKFGEIREGEVWGRNWENAWFHLLATVPKLWQGKPVVAQLNFTGEGLVYSPDGLSLQGLSSGSVFEQGFLRDRLPLFGSCQGGEAVELWVQTAAHSLFGLQLDRDPLPDSDSRYGQFEAKLDRARLCVFEPELWHLALDVEVLFSLMQSLPQDSIRQRCLLHSLCAAADAFGDDNAQARRCREILAPELAKPANASALEVTAVGHAHIDTGWLWPLGVTRQKVGRTVANQVALLEQYPDFVFGASQAAQYAILEQDFPALYERVRQLIAADRWEVQASMWVEPDTLVPSGESLVRQLLYGKNFSRDRFGVDVKTLWLPDAFGYTPALPQILQGCGVDGFLTTKLSWSRFNRFPYDTFRWQGIDGSQVVAHFPPVTNYNSRLSPSHLVPAQDQFQEGGDRRHPRRKCRADLQGFPPLTERLPFHYGAQVRMTRRGFQALPLCRESSYV